MSSLPESVAMGDGLVQSYIGGNWEYFRADENANRSFLARAYPTMKKNNPNTPIMLREAAGTQPRVYARYGMESFTIQD